ncbi:MAG: TRAP transporter small permease [Pseudomonadota bacterium]
MKTLKLLDQILARIEGWLIVLFLSLMVSLTFLQVILRALYTHGHIQWANAILGQVDWAEPFVRLLVLWVTFLGASLLTRENKHIKIDLMSAFLPKKWMPYRELILSMACVLISAFMLKACIDYVNMEMGSGGHLFLKLPTWIGQLILPVGFIMIIFRFSLRGIEQALEIIGNGKS